MRDQLYTLALLLSFVPLKLFAAPDLNGFELVFGDEFDSGSLNENLWNTSPLWGPYQRVNGEDQYYVDVFGINENDHSYTPFSFTSDTLQIVAQPVASVGAAPEQPAAGSTDWQPYPNYQHNPSYSPANRSHLSGMITSSDSFTFTHGYAEIRARIPSGQGLWPAFWLLNSYYVENSPEIDIMEILGHAPDEVHQYAHYFDKDWNGYSSPVTPDPYLSPVDLSEDFHTFGLQWTPTYIAWFVDGVETRRLINSDFHVSTQGMYLIANLAVGGYWPGSPDSTTPFPAIYDIDYIRVYQKTPPTTITPEVLASDYQLIFDDDFVGSTLDTTRWTSSSPKGPFKREENQEQLFVDVLGRMAGSTNSPFVVDNGTLKIQADSALVQSLPQQEPVGDVIWSNYPSHEYYAPYMVDWSPGYTSGLLTTNDTLNFVHGYVEIRAKLPQGGGLWPFLDIPYRYYVGSIPEIQVFGVDGAQNDTARHRYTYKLSSGDWVTSNATSVSGTTDFTADFHTFGVQWHPGLIRWYVDGEIVHTYKGDDVSTQLGYLSLGLAVGGDEVESVTADFPATMEIDYVRAYQLNGEAAVDNGDNGGGAGQLLTVGAVDTGEFGYHFNGDVGHKESVAFLFDHTGSDLILSAVGFDIDANSEVEVVVNGTSIGFLNTSPNEGTSQTELNITSSLLSSSGNLLLFRQTFPGWKWGVTQVLLEEAPPDEQQAQVLSLGVVDNVEYGYRVNGVLDHRERAAFSFDHTGSSVTLSVTGYDIDWGTEVNVLVNEVIVGFLAVTPNDDYGPTELIIDESLLVDGGNSLMFEQQVPGYKWGVSNLRIESEVTEELSEIVLEVGILKIEEYGYNFNGQNDHRTQVTFEFDHVGSDVNLTVSAFDIDTADEVNVLVNGASIGFLARTQNNGTGETMLNIPASMLVEGGNAVSFIQKVPGYTWGVTNLLIDPEPVVDAGLMVGILDSEKYGYNFNGTVAHAGGVSFSFDHLASDLSLSVEGFDIDTINEVEVLINGVSVGFMSTTGNLQTGPSNFTISSTLLSAEINILEFVQQVPGYTWGISQLLLETAEAPVSELELVVGVLDTTEYGFNFNGQKEHREQVEFEFTHAGSDLVLTVNGFDIDAGMEVGVSVNDTSIGFLQRTDNESTGQTVLQVPASVLNNASNTLVFSQRYAGWMWGVTDLILQ